MALFLDSFFRFIYISILIPIPYCCIYYSFILSLEISVNPPTCFFLKMVSITRGPLYFHIRFTISLSSSTHMKVCWDFAWHSAGSIDHNEKWHLSTVQFSGPWAQYSFPFICVSLSISFCNVVFLSIYRYCMCCVKCICEYSVCSMLLQWYFYFKYELFIARI